MRGLEELRNEGTSESFIIRLSAHCRKPEHVQILSRPRLNLYAQAFVFSFSSAQIRRSSPLYLVRAPVDSHTSAATSFRGRERNMRTSLKHDTTTTTSINKIEHMCSIDQETSTSINTSEWAV